MQGKKEDILYKELYIPETKEENLSLFDRTDKSFMIRKEV